MGKGSSFDASEWLTGLAKLADPKLRESLARSMAVAGGKVLRDEAKLQAPVKDGVLRSAIYLAFKDQRSNDAQVVYSVTWNAKIAPHGHNVEMGHWRYNKIVNGRPQKSLRPGLKKGKGPEDHVPPGKLKNRKWVPGKPFLTPAYHNGAQRSLQAMIARGQQRLPELLAGVAPEVTE